MEILRAFQTWAAATNINIGLTADGGANFGTAGAYQSDGRFGDIRIGGTRLHPSALANAMIVSPDNGTWSGDVLFNTAVRYGAGGYDLFTVALHEAGHVLGLEHSDDPNSVMSERYIGTRTGLSASDLATVRSYYGGPRQADGFDRQRANDTRSAATAVTVSGNFTLTGDLTTAADADWYAFRVPAGGRSFTARLTTAGISLLAAELTVVDAAGRVVGTAEATDPIAGNLRVNVTADTGGTYYLKVSSATDGPFGVGRYQLSVVGLGGEMSVVTPAGVEPAPAGSAANMAPPSDEQPVLASGTLTRSANQSRFTLNMVSSGLFRLETEAAANAPGVEFITEVFDADGN